jgi:hypothetical protein
MPVTVGIANLLTSNAAVQAQLAKDSAGYNKYAVWFGAAKKGAIPNYLVIHAVSVPPAEHSMDGPSSLSDGEFQFDSYGNDQPSARKLSQAVRDGLKNYSGGLSDGTTIQFYEVSLDTDDPYEVGGEGYVFRCVLRLRSFFTEPGE